MYVHYFNKHNMDRIKFTIYKNIYKKIIINRNKTRKSLVKIVS